MDFKSFCIRINIFRECSWVFPLKCSYDCLNSSLMSSCVCVSIKRQDFTLKIHAYSVSIRKRNAWMYSVKPTTKLNVTTDRIIPWKISRAIAKLHRIFIIYYLLGILRQEISGFIPVPSGFWPSFCSHFKRFSTRCDIVCGYLCMIFCALFAIGSCVKLF